MRRFVLCLLALLAAQIAGTAHAQERLLAPIFQDHAVLQRDQPIRVWGEATPGERVTITLGARRATVRADREGRWRATLPRFAAGGPYELVARGARGGEQRVSDVLIGDVWLCSGQSNMVLEVRRTLDSRAEIANSANNNLRMFYVPLASNAAPQTEFAGPVSWQVAGPATVSEWSATCFYFARELQRTVRVPMGMINSSWGGSDIRAWMSDAALRGLGGDYPDRLSIVSLSQSDPAEANRRWGRIWEGWWRARAGDAPWSDAPSGDWRDAPTNLGFWETWGPELENFNGMLWYRTNVRLNAAQAAQSGTLSIGPVDEIDETWVNGTFVGGTSSASAARNYAVPAGVLRAGDNTIVVNAYDTYATGGIHGPAEGRALRLANGETIPLTHWRYRVVPTGAVGPAPRMPWEATGGLTTLHNAMISPVEPYNVRGVVWYQGESNTRDAAEYSNLLPALLADWRGKFGARTPFLIVQLAGYGAARAAAGESGTAELREVQRLITQADGNAGLAVAVDLGERTDIHPANKQDVGRRLARAARNVIYGEAIAPSGPRLASVERAGGDVVVRFADVEGALVAYGASRPIGFELCGAARNSCRFVDARIIGADSVAIAAPGDMTPSRVRWCWADSPVCTLYDGANLPAGPFEATVPR